MYCDLVHYFDYTDIVHSLQSEHYTYTALNDGDQFQVSGSRVLIQDDNLWPMAKGKKFKYYLYLIQINIYMWYLYSSLSICQSNFKSHQDASTVQKQENATSNPSHTAPYPTSIQQTPQIEPKYTYSIHSTKNTIATSAPYTPHANSGSAPPKTPTPLLVFRVENDPIPK